LADVLAEWNQQIIKCDPVFGGKFLAQRLLALVRRLGLDIPPSIADPVHMDVHANAGLAVSDCHDQVGRLSSYTGQSQEVIN
jgi:hypothetical protein